MLAQERSAPGMYARWEHRYLAACSWLDELSNGHFSLLKAPLHQLGTADIHRAQHMAAVVFHEGSTVDDQRAPGPAAQQTGQFLSIHHLPREPIPSHGGVVGSGESDP